MHKKLTHEPLGKNFNPREKKCSIHEKNIRPMRKSKRFESNKKKIRTARKKLNPKQKVLIHGKVSFAHEYTTRRNHGAQKT